MNYRSILTIVAAGAALSLSAAVPAPQVSAVSMSQNANGEAIINYSLSAANAVITLDIQTNATGSAWVSIGGEAVSSAWGDVWKVVATGSHRIKWNGASCWADNKIPASGIRAVVTAWTLDNTPDYMVVDISVGAAQNTQRDYPSVDFLPGGLLANDDYRTTKLVMRKIMAKGVEWTMGATKLENRVNSTREATHLVTLTNNYYIGVFEVTQAQWALIEPSVPTPSEYNAADRAMHPVEKVSYNRIRNSADDSNNSSYDWPEYPNQDSFLGKLREKSGIVFDLPSEAQWEFAARAGNGITKWGNGLSIQNNEPDDNLNLYGHYASNANNATAIVGSYAPNAWGLYDMAGNVFELCLDWIADDITGLDGKVNTDSSSGQHVRRGGSYGNTAQYCRPALRLGSAPNSPGGSLGFRVVCTAGLQ